MREAGSPAVRIASKRGRAQLLARVDRFAWAKECYEHLGFVDASGVAGRPTVGEVRPEDRARSPDHDGPGVTSDDICACATILTERYMCVWSGPDHGEAQTRPPAWRMSKP